MTEIKLDIDGMKINKQALYVLVLNLKEIIIRGKIYNLFKTKSQLIQKTSQKT